MANAFIFLSSSSEFEDSEASCGMFFVSAFPESQIGVVLAAFATLFSKFANLIFE